MRDGWRSLGVLLAGVTVADEVEELHFARRHPDLPFEPFNRRLSVFQRQHDYPANDCARGRAAGLVG
jgi:hypothetical protein